MLRTACFLMALGVLAGGRLSAAEKAGAGRPWSSTVFLHDAQAWTEHMEGALVSASADGLRVEVAPGKTWGIAGLWDVSIPKDTGSVRVRVKELGGGGTWLMRLYGDLRGTGANGTLGVFQSVSAPGDGCIEIDPRALKISDVPLRQVQLGLEGPAGSFVIFEKVEFLARPERPNLRPRKKSQPGQKDVDCVERMPNIPQPFDMKDWRGLAKAYDKFVFDFQAQGEHLPFIWLDDSRINIEGPTFGLPSYAGDPRVHQCQSCQESITCMGAVLGATVSGIDKARQEHNYVSMCEAWYNKRNGSHLVLNAMDQGTGGSFWYELWPHIVFYALCDRYPGIGNLEAIMKTTADRWCEATAAMTEKDRIPNFDHTAFDFKTMKPVDNGVWREPDAAAAVAWLEYMAWVRFREQRFLEASDQALSFLQDRSQNPYYENLMPYGVLAAARMNAELGRDYDVDKFLNWCFGISDCRGGWGVVLGNWGGYDCDGLIGSIDNMGGYAFAMNTFTQMGALVPLVRYTPSYARAIGKWMLNAANAARLFYADALPEDQQSSAFWKGDPDCLIAYEGLRRYWGGGKSPVAFGDPIVMKWGPATDRGLYGSSYVGLLGGMVSPTNEEKILQLDCLATDFFHGEAFPTFLFYNPHSRSKRIFLDVGEGSKDLYDAARHVFIQRNVTDQTRISLPADSARLVVVVPSGGAVKQEGKKLLVDGVVIDFDAPVEAKGCSSS